MPIRKRAETMCADGFDPFVRMDLRVGVRLLLLFGGEHFALFV